MTRTAAARKAEKKQAIGALRREAATKALKELGKNVAAQRHTLGLTQAQLAEKLGISIAYMSLIERGERNPPFTFVLRIANTLKTNVLDLSGGF